MVDFKLRLDDEGDSDDVGNDDDDADDFGDEDTD